MMKKKKLFYGWWLVLISAIILAIAGPASITVANIYQEPIMQEFAISKSTFALANSIVLGVGIIFAPLMSRKYAQGNFTYLYAGSLLIYGLSYASYAFAPNIYVYYLISIFVGFGFSTSLSLPIALLLNQWFISKKGLAISLTFTGTGFGGVIFAQFVTWAMLIFGWRMTYLLYGGLIILICVPLVYFFIKFDPKELGLEALHNDKDKLRVKNETTKQLSFEKTYKKPFFAMLIIGAICMTLSLNGGLGQFPPYITELHGAQAAAFAISIYSLVGVFSKLSFGALNDKFGIVFTTFFTTGFLALSFIFMIFAQNYNMMLIGAFVFGSGMAIGTIVTPLITTAMYSGADYAKAYGFVASGNNLGLMLGSLTAATIADATGSYLYSWIVMSIIAALTGVLWIGAYLTSQKYKNNQ